MGPAESLAVWGVLRAPEVVEIATGAGLELASAAAMLEKESYGGRNVWGSDGVDTGGFYVKGGEVTRAAYEAWRPHRSRLGSQGVGPTQLTYPPLQDQADRLGGCWDWRINLTVGCRHLAALQQQYGIRDGFRRYNGSGPAAERYAADAMTRRQKWIDRLGAVGPSTPSTPSTPAPPTTAKDWFDMATKDELRAVLLEALQPYLDPRSPAALASRADVGFAADQIMTGMGIDRTTAPSQLSATERAGRELARRDDVAYVLQQLGVRIDDLERHVEDTAGGGQPAGPAEPIDYDALARSLLAHLGEITGAHQPPTADSAGATAPPQG